MPSNYIKKNPSHHNHPFLIARIWPSKPNNHLETLEHAITHSYLFMSKITRAFRLVYMSNLNIAQFPRFFHAKTSKKGMKHIWSWCF